ncbi:hypothetical protein KM043_016042 [Ampulex compressa]|nr:hypothetical protein KM043_016042 [Ampulex compressa]
MKENNSSIPISEKLPRSGGPAIKRNCRRLGILDGDPLGLSSMTRGNVIKKQSKEEEGRGVSRVVDKGRTQRWIWTLSIGHPELTAGIRGPW